MWEIDQIICLSILIGLSIADIRRRSISIGTLAVCMAMAAGYRCLAVPQGAFLTVGGIGVGFFFLIISKMTRESIGYADSIGVLIMGMYLGLWKILEVVSVSFALLFFAAMFCCLRKRKKGLPFYPFLTAGYVVMLMGVWFL